MPHVTPELVSRAYAALASGDLKQIAEYWAEDMNWLVPGHHQLAGWDVYNRTFQFWHIYVKGIRAGIHYAYRVDGFSDTRFTGNRFNRNKVLIDPYAKGNTDVLWNRVNACGPEDNLATSMRSVVIDTSDEVTRTQRGNNNAYCQDTTFSVLSGQP